MRTTTRRGMKQTTHATHYDDNRKNRKTMREEDERIFLVEMLFDDNTITGR